MPAYFASTNVGLSGCYTHPHYVCNVVLSILFRTEPAGGLSDVTLLRGSFQDGFMHVAHSRQTLHGLLFRKISSFRVTWDDHDDAALSFFQARGFRCYLTPRFHLHH